MFLSKTGLLRIRDGVGRSVVGRPISELGETSIVSMRQDVEGIEERPGYKAAEMRGAIPRRPHLSHGSYLIGSGSVGVHSPNSSLHTYRLNGLWPTP